MATSFHHVAVFFVLIFTWFWMTKARLVSQGQRNFLQEPSVRDKMRNEKGTKFFLTDEYVPEEMAEVGRSFRAPRKIIQPRATRMGDFELFTARGYGKRSAAPCVDGTMCKKQLPFFGARRYGKRDAGEILKAGKMSRIFCLLSHCRNTGNSESTSSLKNIANYLQHKQNPLEDDNGTVLDD